MKSYSLGLGPPKAGRSSSPVEVQKYHQVPLGPTRAQSNKESFDLLGCEEAGHHSQTSVGHCLRAVPRDASSSLYSLPRVGRVTPFPASEEIFIKRNAPIGIWSHGCPFNY